MNLLVKVIEIQQVGDGNALVVENRFMDCKGKAKTQGIEGTNKRQRERANESFLRNRRAPENVYTTEYTN